MQGTEWGWRNLATLLLLVGGTIAIGVFLVIEHLRSQALIELGLFRIPPFTGGVLIFFTFQFDKVVVFVFMPLYLQQVLQLSPIAAGLPLVVATLPTMITSIIAGRSADRFGSRMPTIVGLLLNGSALLFMGIGAAAKSYEAIFSALILWGIILPFASVVPRRALMSAVPETHQGQASGVNLTVQMMGGTIGMAVATVVLTATRRFELIFLVTGLLVLASIMAAWFTFDRRPASHT
jgi:predicted MFS family arabinose efflux permease